MEGKLILNKNQTIIWALDAGHGSNTPGKRSPVWPDGTQLFEWEYVRKIRNEIIALLDLYQMSYYIVNPEDYDVGLTKRTNRINEVRKSSGIETITISIHGNAAGVESASGYEVFTSPGQTKSDPIAEIFYKHAENSGIFRMRPDLSDGDHDKEARFTILTKTNGPAILTESGFYTNHKECIKMMDRSYITKIGLMHFTSMLEIENIK
jgi:N-acetylmuramoyl-L-alanine amidase